MAHSSLPTEADIARVLDGVFRRCEAENKFPQLITAVISKLSKTYPGTAMVVMRTLVDEAIAMLPDQERTKVMSQFAEFANFD
jgi:hypothetical protein